MDNGKGINKGQYKTLRVIDGKEYVELGEVNQVIKNLSNFQTAIKDVAGALNTIKKATSEFDKIVSDI